MCLLHIRENYKFTRIQTDASLLLNGWNQEIKRRRNELKHYLTALWMATLGIANLSVKAYLKFGCISVQATVSISVK